MPPRENGSVLRHHALLEMRRIWKVGMEAKKAGLAVAVAIVRTATERRVTSGNRIYGF